MIQKIVLLLLSLVIGIVQSRNQIQIISPTVLLNSFPQGQIEFSIANFGFVPYGRQISGNLTTSIRNNEFADYSSGCDNYVKRASHSKDFHFLAVFRQKDYENCSIPRQALKAAQAGYSLLIVVDYADEDLENLEIEDQQHNADINIPVIIISKHDGDQIMNELMAQHLNHQQLEGVELEIFFPTPKKNYKVIADYWYDPMQQQSYDFLNHMQDFMQEIKFDNNLIDFQVKFPLFECYECSINEFSYPHPDCIGNGRYCSLDPDGAVNQNRQTGSDSSRVKLLQKCVHQKSTLEQYFNYINFFRELCLSFSGSRLDDCSYEIMKEKLDINFKSVKQCYDNSFGTKNPIQEQNFNSILDKELMDYESTKELYYPGLIVNGYHFRGDISQRDAVYEFMCESFIEPPEFCRQWGKWVFGKDHPRYREGMTYRMHFIGYLIEYTVGFVILGLIVFIIMQIYKRMVYKDINTQMQSQVNEAMTQYYALKDKLEDTNNTQESTSTSNTETQKQQELVVVRQDDHL